MPPLASWPPFQDDSLSPSYTPMIFHKWECWDFPIWEDNQARIINIASSILWDEMLITQSCLTGIPWPTRLLCPWSSPGKNTGVGCHFLLQGFFPTQGLNLGLLPCRQTLYWLSHLGSPILVYINNILLEFSMPESLPWSLKVWWQWFRHGELIVRKPWVMYLYSSDLYYLSNARSLYEYLQVLDM